MPANAASNTLDPHWELGAKAISDGTAARTATTPKTRESRVLPTGTGSASRRCGLASVLEDRMAPIVELVSYFPPARLNRAPNYGDALAASPNHDCLSVASTNCHPALCPFLQLLRGFLATQRRTAHPTQGDDRRLHKALSSCDERNSRLDEYMKDSSQSRSTTSTRSQPEKPRGGPNLARPLVAIEHGIREG